MKGNIMKKGSFSVEKATSKTDEHNSREVPPKYLIEVDEDFDGNYHHDHYDEKTFIKQAKTMYQNKFKQKMQKSQIDKFCSEVVISMNSDHTQQDIYELFDKLNKEFGGHTILSVSCHFDEGHFLDPETGVTYYPNTHIKYFEREKVWRSIPLEKYLDPSFDEENPAIEEFTEPADMDKLQKVMNIHAHVKFTMFDLEKQKTSRMNRNDWKRRYKVVCDHMNLKYDPGKGRHMYKSTKQHKNETMLKRNQLIREMLTGEQHELEKQKLIEEKQELHEIAQTTLNELSRREDDWGKVKIYQSEIEKKGRIIREAIKKSSLSNQKKKELHKENNDLKKAMKKLNKSKELDINEYVDKINDLESEIRQMPSKETIEELYKDTVIVEEFGGVEKIQEAFKQRNELEKQVYEQLSDIKRLKVIDSKNSNRILELMEEQRLSKMDAKEKDKLYTTLRDELEAFVADIDDDINKRRYNLVGFIKNKFNTLIQALENLSNDLKNWEKRFNNQKAEVEKLKVEVEKLKTENEKLIINKDELKTSFEDELSSKDDEIKELKEQLKEKDEHIEELENPFGTVDWLDPVKSEQQTTIKSLK